MFQPFFASSLAYYPNKLRTLDVTSCRVHIAGKVNNVSVSDLIIDTATDLPCVSQTFIDNYSSLKRVTVHSLPHNCFNLRSAQGSKIEVIGFRRCNLTLGNIDRLIAPLVIPFLGSDKLLLDNAILSSFKAVLDWEKESLFFKSSNVTVTATHRRNMSNMTYSALSINSDAQPMPVRLVPDIHIPANSEIVVEVRSDRAPAIATTAVIDPPPP